MVRKLVLAVAAASALMSSNMVQALGVGEINLRSALNQPLDAEIELLQVRDLSSAEIRSVLASPDDFGKAGIDRAFFLTDLTFTPVVQPNGRSYIRVTSSRPVREPYLNFLMEVRWPSGRVLREFTLLLDPPMYDPTPVTFSAPVTPPAAASAPAPRSSAAPVVRQPAPAAAPRAAAAPSQAGSAARDGQRRTTRDDTLWAIAMETRPQGASVHQTMLAIQDLNPNAFIDNNINALRAGQTLTLPTAEQAAARSNAEAIAEVGNQNAAWRNRQRPAAEPAQRQLDARERSVAGAAPAQSRGEDSLRLVAAGDSAKDTSSSGGSGDLRDALDQTREQLDTSEQARNELASRLSDLESQVETLQRLLTLKDAQLAALQQELAADGQLPDILPVPEAEQVAELSAEDAAGQEPGDVAPDTEITEAEGVEPSAATVAEGPDAAGEAPAALAEAEPADADDGDAGESADAADDEQVALVAPGAVDTQAGNDPQGGAAATPEPSAPVTGAAPPAAQTDSSPQALLQRFMQNQTLVLSTGAVALLILLLILMSVARRNARREAELAEDYARSGLASGAAAGAAAAAESAEGDEFNVALAEAQQEPVQDETADISPDAELDAALAEIDDSRDELLGGGLEDGDQRDAELPAEHAEDGLDAFEVESSLEEELAESDQAATEAMDFDFADFGLEEESAASLADSNESEPGFDLDFDLDEIPAEGAEASVEPVAEEPLVFQEPEVESPLAEPAADDFDLTLDDELQVDNLLAEFDALSDAEPDSTAVEQPETPAEDEFSLSDEDLASFEAQLQSAMQGEEQVGAGAPQDQEEPLFETPALLDEGLGDDLIDGELDEDFAFLSDTDECATKLDLARAYIDMGDEEGARDILAEVVEEGNEQQRQDAREMMEQLG